MKQLENSPSRTAKNILHYTKYLGFTLVIFGILVMILDDSSGSEVPLMVGLFTLLIASERVQDERAVQLKTTSLYIAFVVSYTIKLLSSNLHDHGLISFELTEINHFIILVLFWTNALFFSRMYFFKD